MTLCINPRCSKPQNPNSTLFCQACGSEVLLQGRYRAVSELGRGGFGKTYEVSDQGTPKVLKILINTSPKAISLFKREAQVLSQLIDPGIPRVEAHGYFEHPIQDGQAPVHCFVMEKIEGDNLHSYIKKRGRPIDGEMANRWLIELLLILQQVHNQGILHRDIKPQNIILKPDGKLALIDFGAVTEGTGTKVATETSKSGATKAATQTGGGTSIWTRGYAPIEQINGEAVPQSDFFGLGRTFVFLLTGKEPTDRTIYDASNDELKWQSHASDVLPHLAKVIDHMIARLARERPINAQAILQQLEAPSSSSEPKQGAKGKDIEVDLEITEQEAISGTSKEITFLRTVYPNGTSNSSRQETKKLTVKVAPKSQHGSRLRLAGQGNDGQNGEVPGDVYVRLSTKSTDNDDLSSERLGENYYVELRDLLKAKDWKAANAVTIGLILVLASRQQEQFLRKEDILKIPPQDLRIIDQLWMKYSDGHSGFSVQKKTMKHYGNDYHRFFVARGWDSSMEKEIKALLDDSILILNIKELPPGMLPFSPLLFYVSPAFVDKVGMKVGMGALGMAAGLSVGLVFPPAWGVAAVVGGIAGLMGGGKENVKDIFACKEEVKVLLLRLSLQHHSSL